MEISKSFFEYRPAAHLLVSDEDAADFLQSQFTNNLRPFKAGQSTYGLWLDVKGKVVADSVILCEGEESFRIFSDCCEGAAIAAHLERHIIADDVVIEHCEAGFGFEVFGDHLEECLNGLDLRLPELGQSVSNSRGWIYSKRKNVYHVVLVTEEDATVLRSQLSEAGYASLSADERGLARIAAGVPLIPCEVGANDLPGEGELADSAISFTKGCYLGQEVVARMHNIGKPTRRLFVVEGKGAAPETPLALYNGETKKVGELRTSYQNLEAWIGVAMLKIRFAEVGDTLQSDAVEIKILRTLKGGLTNG